MKRTNTKGIRLGAAIRRMRRERSLTQKRLASILGISTPYLNLIENNRRNVTGKILIILAQEFNMELADIGKENDANLLSDIMEVFSDSVFDDNYLKNHDVQDLVSSQPEIAKAIIRLYDIHKTNQNQLSGITNVEGGESNFEGMSGNISAEIISDLIQKNSNYFPSLEKVASNILKNLNKPKNINLFVPLSEYLAETHNIRVATIPPEIKHDTIRYYDPVAKTLVISDRLPQASRTFLVAQQMGLLLADKEIDTILDDNNIEEGEVRKLGRLALSNYFAGAIILPYETFYEQALFTKYDIEVLENRFQVSFEQVCHRLTTLNKPGMRGIPFHMMRVDIAGNISKRFSASGIAISRYSGACPRLNIYSAFTTPDRIKVQVSIMPNDEKYFCIARAFQKRSGGFDAPESFYSIGLGCSLNDASEMIYGERVLLDSSENIVPVGVSCRSCPRIDCRQRAFPPSNHQLTYNENVKGLSAYVTPS
ncbi:MAG: XRE family transcriptional regulator [Pelagibacterales bacterium]|nr:XRE family transcriptional regulator [Pelagibacterales bacterium]